MVKKGTRDNVLFSSLLMPLNPNCFHHLNYFVSHHDAENECLLLVD